jgi:hypothetical protein
MDEQQLTSLTDTHSITATALPTLTDSTHLTCYDLGDDDRLSLQLWSWPMMLLSRIPHSRQTPLPECLTYH